MVTAHVDLPISFALTIANHTLPGGQVERTADFFFLEEALAHTPVRLNMTVTPSMVTDGDHYRLRNYLMNPFGPLMVGLKHYYHQELSNARFSNLLAQML